MPSSALPAQARPKCLRDRVAYPSFTQAMYSFRARALGIAVPSQRSAPPSGQAVMLVPAQPPRTPQKARL